MAVKMIEDAEADGRLNRQDNHRRDIRKHWNGISTYTINRKATNSFV